MKRLTHLIATLALFLTAQLSIAEERPRIVAVNHALQLLAEELVGGQADVSFPVPKGVDPSFWRPSITEISEVQSADLILLNGAGFAAWVDRVTLPRSRIANTTAQIKDRFIATESVTHSHGDGGTHSHEGVASYTWLDPMLAIAQAEAIAAAISARQLLPAQEVYGRLTDLRVSLEAVDAEAQSALSAAHAIPMIATHPRYQYFARRYGLTIEALEWEAGAMPSDAQLQNLAARLAETGAQVLIWEAAPPEGAFAATAALGVQNVVFPPMAHLSEGSFIESFGTAVTALSTAVAKVTD